MVILLLLALAFLLRSSSATIIDTTTGPIQGFAKNISGVPVQVFFGIPYAKPPIGNLRFRKPVPVKPWTKTLYATKLPPACMQHTIYPFPWYDDLPGKSEDCLYLNIYAPIHAKKGSDLAVLFWIHGGGLLTGSSRIDIYDGSALASIGNVVVVTMNYRLGVFGFLTSNTTDAPGNLGFFDMYMALQWVNENIASFGGDQKRITIAGESAGSMSVSLLCVSPLTKGLFSKAILESSSIIAVTTNPLRINLDISQQVAVAAGCVTESRTIEKDAKRVVGCLRNHNASYLATILWSLNPTASVLFRPQFGDALFPSKTIDIIRNGEFHNVPLLIGNNLDEGSFLMTTANPDIFGFFGQKNAKINKTYGNELIQKYFRSSMEPEIYAKYYLDSVADGDFDAIRKQIYTAVGDVSFLCPTMFFAESYAERENDVYFYFFVHRPNNTPWSPWMGAAHFDEVQFVFGQPILEPDLYKSYEIELSRKMIDVWTNFVKHGTPSYCVNWPKYSKDKHDFVYIDTEFTGDSYGNGPHLNNCNFLRSFFGF